MDAGRQKANQAHSGEPAEQSGVSLGELSRPAGLAVSRQAFVDKFEPECGGVARQLLSALLATDCYLRARLGLRKVHPLTVVALWGFRRAASEMDEVRAEK